MAKSQPKSDAEEQLQLLRAAHSGICREYLVKLARLVKRLDPEKDNVKWGEVTSALKMLGELLHTERFTLPQAGATATDPLADLQVYPRRSA